MSRLLALDQASRISGWAFFNEGQLEAHGKFNATQEDIGERLFFIKNAVNKHGIYNFRIEVLEEIDKTESEYFFKQRELFWMDKCKCLIQDNNLLMMIMT